MLPALGRAPPADSSTTSVAALQQENKRRRPPSLQQRRRPVFSLHFESPSIPFHGDEIETPVKFPSEMVIRDEI